MTLAIQVGNLGKQYRLGSVTQAGYRTFREALVGLAAAPLRRPRVGRTGGKPEMFWALRDVSFGIRPGEVVGIIGRNGAGKSTLLKILSRITAPTAGRVELHGRVGSLLEVGTGFHPELTGRENIVLNGAILGMSRREIARKFDQIVEFAEVERFLDTPVKRYSSGMYVRLAFAVAAHLEPEIMLVDEVLAVGDVVFQRKCLGKMNALSEGGRTVLFVSHNMPAVRSITKKCIYLRGGRVVQIGDTPEVIDTYLEDAWEGRGRRDAADLDYYRRDRNGNPDVRITGVTVLGGGDGGPVPTLRTAEDFTVRCEFRASRAYPRAYVAFSIMNQQGERVATFLSSDRGDQMSIREGASAAECRIHGLPLSPGRYSLTIGVTETIGATALDVIVDYPALEVTMPKADSGELEWPQRPYGCVHWEDVTWSEGF
jgi:lipopolysaccharide transport system ATP-binding protein